MRPTWFQDEPNRPFQITPLARWRGVDLLMLVLAVFQVLVLLFHVDRFLLLQPEHLANPLRWYEFVTYALVHSRSDIFHLLFNLLVLFFFGRQVEVSIGGRPAFFRFAAAAALSAALVYLAVETFRFGSAQPMLGASGIAYACIVAFATLQPHAEVIALFVPIRAWVLATLLMLVALYTSLVSPFAGVAHVAHLGGGAFGFLYVRYRHVAAGLIERVRAERRASQRERDVDRRREMDRILEKISREGLNSLTRAERKFLDSASKDLRNRR